MHMLGKILFHHPKFLFSSKFQFCPYGKVWPLKIIFYITKMFKKYFLNFYVWAKMEFQGGEKRCRGEKPYDNMY
jgi:hypothetical protein